MGPFIFCDHPLPYRAILFLMHKTLEAMRTRDAPEGIWFLEHQPVYTYGRLTQAYSLPKNSRIPCFSVTRGGNITYHGPGQLMVYPLIDLRQRGWNVSDWLDILHQWGVNALQALGLPVWSDSGFWLKDPTGERQKIGSMGIHIQQGISYHGFAINRTEASLEAFQAIQPCGLICRMTSLENQAIFLTHQALAEHFWNHLPSALK